MKQPDVIERLYRSLAVPLFRSFTGINMLLHMAAIAVTVFFVDTGTDWAFYRATGQSELILRIAFTAAVVGVVVPVLLPVALYIYGFRKSKHHYKSVALVLMQAVILALLVSSAYKAVTGRMPPEYTVSFTTSSLHHMTQDVSNVWGFGFMERGVFDGWPSGHTTSAFAMAVAAIAVSPRHRKLHVLLLLYALYMGLGVGTTIHWLSDAVAGMLIGIAIGRAVGHNKLK